MIQPLSPMEFPLITFVNTVVARSGLQVCVAPSEAVAQQICVAMNEKHLPKCLNHRVEGETILVYGKG